MQQQLQKKSRLQILDLVRQKEWRQIVSVYCSDNHTKCKKEKQHMVWYSAMWRWNINNLPLLTIWSQILKVPMTRCGRLLGSGLPQVGGYSAILHKITTYIHTPTFEVHRVEGSKNLWFSKIYIFHTFQALYCRARCADSKKVSYVGVGLRKVGLKRAKLPLASAK